jgi:large subunit ribosomal protein L35
MPKIKTHKATAKRFTKTKTNKLMRRKAGQDHFNARETGNTKRNKRKDIIASTKDVKNLLSLMPYK